MKQIADAMDSERLVDWSRDGHIFYQRRQRPVWTFLAAAPREELQLANPQVSSYGAHLSPDGKWLAYVSAQSGSFEVFVERFPRRLAAKSDLDRRWYASALEQ